MRCAAIKSGIWNCWVGWPRAECAASRKPVSSKPCTPRIFAAHGSDMQFWRGRRVLLTGHTGFKGAWMSLWLKSLGAEVTGYALPPDRRTESVELDRPGCSRGGRDALGDRRHSGTAAGRRGHGAGRPADRDPHGRAGAGQRVVSRSARHLRHQCHGHRHAAAGLPFSVATCSAWSSSPATRCTKTTARAAPSRKAIGSAAMIRTATARLARNC